MRAIEVFKATGVSFANLRVKGTPAYNALVLMPHFNRELLFKKIDKRVEEHFAHGLLREVGSLAKKFGFDAPGMKSISYHELKDYFEKRLSGSGAFGGRAAALDAAKQSIMRHNHVYVRRQVTWFKKMPKIKKYSTPTEALQIAKKFLAKET
mgnify:CR=1 FL=1